jgi:hypothetical protein
MIYVPGKGMGPVSVFVWVPAVLPREPAEEPVALPFRVSGFFNRGSFLRFNVLQLRILVVFKADGVGRGCRLLGVHLYVRVEGVGPAVFVHAVRRVEPAEEVEISLCGVFGFFNLGSLPRPNGLHHCSTLAVKGDGVVDGGDGRGGIAGLGVRLGFAFAFRAGSGFRIRTGFGAGAGIRAGIGIVYGCVADRDKEAQKDEKYKKKTT